MSAEHMPKDKEVRRIAECLVEQGWRLERNTRTSYVFAYPPNGGRPVKLPSTPAGSGRWRTNLIALLRRQGATLK